MLEQGLRRGRERLRERPGVRGGNEKVVRQMVEVADDDPGTEGDGFLQQFLDGGAVCGRGSGHIQQREAIAGKSLLILKELRLHVLGLRLMARGVQQLGEVPVEHR